MVVIASPLGFHRKERGDVLIVSRYGLGDAATILKNFILVLLGEPLIVSTDRQDTPL